MGGAPFKGCRNFARRARIQLDVAQGLVGWLRKTCQDKLLDEANMYRNILVPIDDSPTSDRGRKEAIAIGKGLGARLHFLHIVDPRLLFAEVTSTISPQQLLDDWRAAGERLVAQAIADATAAGVSAEAAVRCEPGRRVCDEILEESKRSEADLIRWVRTDGAASGALSSAATPNMS